METFQALFIALFHGFLGACTQAQAAQSGCADKLLPMKDTQQIASKVVRSLRLSQKADKLLRAHVGRKGDVSIRVTAAITGTDLRSVPVVPRIKAPGSGRTTFLATSVSFDCALYAEIAAIAAERNTSVASLIDAAVVAFYARRRKAPG